MPDKKTAAQSQFKEKNRRETQGTPDFPIKESPKVKSKIPINDPRT